MEENKTENATTTPTTPAQPVVENKVEKQNPNPQPASNTTTNPPKKKKHLGLKISIIVIILAIIIGAIGAAVYYLKFASKEIDLSKYISIDFDGYEGYFTVDEDSIVIDEKALKKDIDDSKVSKKLIEKIENGITIKNGDDLENGDKVTVKIKVSSSWLEENKLKLASNELTFEVKGLKEPEEVDIFKDIVFEISGISPNATLEIKNNSKDSFIKDITFNMEDEDGDSSMYGSLYNVKNGDKVTITANYKDSALQDSGYTIKKNTYVYVVEGAPEYLVKEADFSSDVEKAISKGFIEEIKEDSEYSSFSAVYSLDETIDYSDTFKASEPELVNLYLLVDKDYDENSYIYWDVNKVYGIYKVTYTSEVTSNTYDYYYTAYCSDVVIDKDGLYDNDYYFNVSSAYSSSEYAKSPTDAYNYFIESQKEVYDITKIK